MSTGWSIFVIVTIIANVGGCAWLLFANRSVEVDPESKGKPLGHDFDGIEELNNPLPRWWLHLFNITIVFALVYLALYPGLGNLAGYLGWTQDQRYDEELQAAEAKVADIFEQFSDKSPEQLMADNEAMGTARRLFGQNCAMCHGSDAGGAYGFPDLTDNEWQWGTGFENIYATISAGRQAAMPSWSAPLGEDGVEQVTEYVMQLSGQEADASKATEGQQKFGMFCIACHGADGTGNPILGAPDLSNDIWLYRGDRETIMQALHDGRDGKMPAFEGQLTEGKRRLLAAYVMSLGGNNNAD